MSQAPADAAADDPFLWLEGVEDPRALAWARERNAVSQGLLGAQPGFAADEARILQVLNSRDRIPYISRIGAHVYNFWTDDAHPRGLWRRTTLADYRNAQPAWEVVLDVDALGKAEGRSWVWHGASPVPSRIEGGIDRCLVFLSPGGSDAHVTREFDLVARQFVPDGFTLPEAKSRCQWIDRDTLYVGTDFGPGSMTSSGYPRMIKRWRRGTPLSQAQLVFEGRPDDVSVGAWVQHLPGGRQRHFLSRSIDFYRGEDSLLLDDGRLQRIEKPDDADLQVQGDLMLLHLRSDWTVAGTTHPSGALLATSLEAFLRGERRFDVLFAPTPTRSLERNGVALTRSHVLLNVLDNVGSRLEELHRTGTTWQRRAVPLPAHVRLWVQSLHDEALDDDPLADAYLAGREDFLTPDTLLMGKAGDGVPETLKQRPALFDSTGMRTEQLFATSRDGTKVPYFVVWPHGASADGENPTLLYGYGGFEVSLLPSYQAVRGDLWLRRGGVLVIANLRGGGEFGPRWHQAAVREHKQRSYDDFIAVAEDLVARRITSPHRLGIQGGSNGGLLMGAAFTQRPDLFGAVVCQVPLLDMRRYHRLLAGASWMAEYGDPDEAGDWAFIGRYSPYQQVKPGVRYPRVLFTTSTRDDRVHPAHARKMVARMQAQGHDVLYYENTEGGHGGAADPKQQAHLRALEFAYLWMQLGRPTR
ncbi:prolyl oligopeptidase family serine peptidase [Ramlibacter sp. MMS24-I3-19]|uniref:prolyl oligopeptidase family serine peptidase n=1 Tax=Ramlibacter sp. MMS24-I3-19 TaxID=3416606 RepID=UPI003CFE22CC